MNSFINAINMTTTANGALAHKSTGSHILDFFYHGATLRKDAIKAKKLFKEAFYEDATTALRILFYIRDIRGGQGEREVFRKCLFWLAMEHPAWVINNWKLIPEYGRWDDLVMLVDASIPNHRNICENLYSQLVQDLTNMSHNKPVSLLAKWMPSENASNPATRAKAKFIMKLMNIKPKFYRKGLVQLRKHISIVENNLRTKEYSTIKYDELPGKALMKYRKAFHRNDEERFTVAMTKAANGEAKVNSGTLYPYEIVQKYGFDFWSNDGWGRHYSRNTDINPTLEAAWSNLPDYVDDISGLVVADTSGSMSGMPINVSVSLALYIAERNKNEAFKDYFITFSEKPTLQKIEGKTLRERINCLESINPWNTDLQAVFNLVLDRAVKSKVPVEDMPKTLIIVSDMQFDQACTNNNSTNLERIRERYNEAGYPMPTLVFWNVNSYSNVPAKMNDDGVLLLSGCSPTVLQYAVSSTFNPMDMVYKITESERYKNIVF